MNPITKTVVASVLTAAFVGPVTWGFSQQIIADKYSITLGKVSDRVVVVEKTMERHEVLIAENKVDIDRTDKIYEARIGNIIKLWEEQLRTERDLIKLVSEQNAINVKLMEQLAKK